MEEQTRRGNAFRGRLRSGLRRHGVIPRPAALARVLRAADVRFTSGNSIALYRDGASGLHAMLEAIETAAVRIHLETYILRTDGTGRRFIDTLAERARAGVEVRVLYDALGSRGFDPEPIAELRAAGADITAFNPLRRFYPRWAPRRRDHRKILVIDGVVARSARAPERGRVGGAGDVVQMRVQVDFRRDQPLSLASTRSQ